MGVRLYEHKSMFLKKVTEMRLCCIYFLWRNEVLKVMFVEIKNKVNRAVVLWFTNLTFASRG